MTKITTTPILLIIIIKKLINHFIIHVRLLFLAVTSYTIVSNSILIILMLFLLRMSSSWFSSSSSWHHNAMKKGKKCNKITKNLLKSVKFVVILISPHQRLKSNFFEKFSLLLWGSCSCLVVVVKKFQKKLISAFEEAIIISDISTNSSLNCKFFEFLKHSLSWFC